MRGGADLGGQELDQPRPGAGGGLLQGPGEDRRHHLQPQVSPSSVGVINVRQTKYLQISHTYMLKLTPMHFSIASLHVDKHLIIGSKAMFDSLMQTDLHTSKLYNSIMILPEDENSQNSQ